MSTATYLAVVFGTVAVAALALLIVALGTIDDYREQTRLQRLREQALRAALLDDAYDDAYDAIDEIADIGVADDTAALQAAIDTANELRDHE